jgi:hypothetical protein
MSVSPLHTLRMIFRLAGCEPGGATVRAEQWEDAAAGGEAVTVTAPAATTAASRMASLRKVASFGTARLLTIEHPRSGRLTGRLQCAYRHG